MRLGKIEGALHKLAIRDSNVCGAGELDDELQGVAARPGRDKRAHPSFPP